MAYFLQTRAELSYLAVDTVGPSADQIINWWSPALNVVSTNGMKLIPCNYECNTGLERGLFISLFLFFLSSSSSFGYLLSSSSCTGYLLCTALTTWLCGASLW